MSIVEQWDADRTPGHGPPQTNPPTSYPGKHRQRHGRKQTEQHACDQNQTTLGSGRASVKSALPPPLPIPRRNSVQMTAKAGGVGARRRGAGAGAAAVQGCTRRMWRRMWCHWGRPGTLCTGTPAREVLKAVCPWLGAYPDHGCTGSFGRGRGSSGLGGEGHWQRCVRQMEDLMYCHT